jgi:hypothetical protein
MLFKSAVLESIAAGTTTLAFRRWRRPTVRPGGRLRTPIGVLAIERVDVVAEEDIAERDALRAGFASRAALLAEVGNTSGTLHRIAFRLDGPDPRAALREDATLTPEARLAIEQRLARMDAGPHGRWTNSVIVLIAERPGRRAGDLAATMGADLKRFKSNVRRLKELGLTESLEVGYRLSPRGRAFLDGRSA